MNPELLGMSNEELIQWACNHGAIEEKKLRKMMPDIEAYCAKMPVSIYDFMEVLIRACNTGVELGAVIQAIRMGVFVEYALAMERGLAEGDMDAAT